MRNKQSVNIVSANSAKDGAFTTGTTAKVTVRHFMSMNGEFILNIPAKPPVFHYLRE